jgi:hypothetical protein
MERLNRAHLLLANRGMACSNPGISATIVSFGFNQKPNRHTGPTALGVK